MIPSYTRNYRPKTLVFDLDGTIIHRDFVRSVPHRIARYAVERLGYPLETAQAQCAAEYRMHGTNLEAFFVNNLGSLIDVDEYHKYIHGHLPYHTLPKVSRTFRDALSRHRCFLFTNADSKHASTCLEALGIGDIFLHTSCFETLQSFKHDAMPGEFVIKPKDVSMRSVIHATGVPRDEIVFFDDCIDNIHMAWRNSVHGVLVSPRFDPSLMISSPSYISDIRHFENVL